MSFSHGRKPVSEHVYADTLVWQCPQCECWSRVEFIYVDNPSCPLCQSGMKSITKKIRIE